MITWLPPALDKQLGQCDGLNFFDYQVLALLSFSPDESQRMSEVARLVHSSLTRLSHAVDRMERKGWIERGPDATDRRCTLIQLTDVGLRLAESATPSHLEIVRRLVFDALTPRQIRQLIAIMSRLAVPPPG